MAVRFKDTPTAVGTVYALEEDGMVAHLINLSQKLQDMGCGEETHEPLENLEPISDIKVGQRVFFKNDGSDFSGEVFEFVDDGMVAGLKDLSPKLAALGADPTHEPVDNLAQL
uniref:Uncharacterized protein n=1 Tax=Calcidiscus leptoporus TaxID=127549 RepID=A0A7S0IMW1_9EUKA